MQNDQIGLFIDVLHAIRFERHMFASSPKAQQRTDELIASLVAGQRNLSGGAPSLCSEIAQRVIEAEQNWSKEAGTTFCGSMEKP